MAACALTCLAGTTAHGGEERPVPPVLTFVSAPDLLNGDVADVRPSRRGRGWERGDPNSWNADYEAAVRTVFGSIASHDPDAVLVAGDLVEGHWGIDVDRTGIFGPVDTFKQRRRAVRRAGNTYYGAWKSYFATAGVDPSTVYPAVGDHEVGDNPWPAGSFKHRAVGTFKSVWRRHFTRAAGGGQRFPMRPRGTRHENTAYARWLGPDVLLVTVDVFHRTPRGVVTTVQGGQLRWLKKLVGRVPADKTVIVQGHTPAIGPVRSRASSRLFLRGGEENPFWRFINDSGNVDFYFAGEVHAHTARQTGQGSTVQVTHGGLFTVNGTSYVVGRVFADGRTTLDSYDFRVTRDDPALELWQTSMKRPVEHLSYEAAAVHRGGLTLQDGAVTASWGDLALNPALERGIAPGVSTRPAW